MIACGAILLSVVSALAFAAGVEGPAATGATAPAVTGPQVWNCEPWQSVLVGDFSGTNPAMKSLQPVALVAARNGVASGFVVVSRTGGAISNLSASVGDLVQAGTGRGRIASARIRVGFADQARYGESWASVNRFDRLLPTAPAEILPADPLTLSYMWNSKKQWYVPKTTNLVATVPVWVTVRVPADAVPGDYEGTLTVNAAGLTPGPALVPVRLRVHDWRMPDPKDFRVRTMGWLNPEALARHYQVPLWSDRHFALMGKSMDLMLELGSRQAQITVTRGYPIQDNTDTMIKWIRQADGTYTYDFTLFDKYCDLVAARIGKPFPLRINIWHGPGDRPKGDHPQRPVLVLDPATGETSELPICAALGSEEDRKFWKPVFEEMRARLERRGWFDVTGCNWINYSSLMVNPKLVDMVKEFWPEREWTDIDHGRMRAMPTSQKGVTVPIFVQSTVWQEGTLNAYWRWTAGAYPRQYARCFNPKTAFCGHARNQFNESSPLWRLRSMHEEIILKGNDGLDMIGADMFPSKNARGQFYPGAWAWAAQGPGNGTRMILGAGPDGPISSERFEAMREGIQLCEAMVFIQKSLESRRLSGKLEARANQVLDDRARALAGSFRAADPKRAPQFDPAAYATNALLRDNELYATAAEVARALDEK